MKRANFNPRQTLLASIGILIWMTIIIAAYYWVNKPFTLPFARAVGGAVVDLATMVAFLAVAGGLGRWILRQFSLSGLSVPERLAAGGLVGLGALAPLILITGSVTLNALSMFLLLATLATIVRSDLRNWIREAISCLGGAWKSPQNAWHWFLAFFVVLMILLALFLAVLPPVKWDVLTYHLAGPADYVRHGRFYANLDNHYLGFPQEVDALYAAQLAITGRLTGSALLHWAMGVLTVVMVGAFAGRHFGVGAGLVAGVTLLVAKSIWLELTFAYADLMAMGLAMVGLAIIDQQRPPQASDCGAGASRSTQHAKTLLGVPLEELAPAVFLGAISGLAMGTKYTVLWMGIAFGILTLWSSWRKPWRIRLISAAVYGLAAVVTIAPWLVRNTIWYDSPVYPLVFEAGAMDAIRQTWYEQTGTGLLFTEDAWQVPILPIAATILGVEGGGAYGHNIGPLFLLLSPILVLSWSSLTDRERRALAPAAVFVGVITAIWILNTGLVSQLNQRTRFVFYMFPPLAVLAGVGLDSLRRWPTNPLNLNFVVRSIVVLVIVFTTVDYMQTVNQGGFLEYFSGRGDFEENHLYRGLGWHYEAMKQVNALPPGSTVRFLWEPRYLYCDGELITCRTDSLMDGWYYARRTVGDGDPGKIARHWQAEGIDHFLVYEFGRLWEQENNRFYEPADWIAWDYFAQEHLDELWRGQMDDADVQYIIYRWQE